MAHRLLFLLAIPVLACSSAPTVGPLDGELPLGTWGGDSAGMIVSDTALHLHVGCTFGDVSGRVHVNADGSFEAVGNYTLHAFPTSRRTYRSGQVHRKDQRRNRHGHRDNRRHGPTSDRRPRPCGRIARRHASSRSVPDLRATGDHRGHSPHVVEERMAHVVARIRGAIGD